MRSLILPSRLTRQPQGVAQIDRSNPLGAKVIECLPLNGQMATAVSRATITLGSGGSKAVGPRGYSLRGSGSASRASVPLNLQAYNKITLAFWLYWDAFANNDALAMEFCSSYSANNGFIVDPNCSSPAAVMFGAGGTGGSNLATFPRPSAGVWHRILLTMDRTAVAGAIGAAYVDGNPQAVTAFPGAISTTGNFASDTLHLLSRNEGSLFGTGNLETVTFYNGILSAAEAAQDYQNSYQIFTAGSSSAYRAMTGAPASAAPTSVTASVAWTEGSDTSMLAAVVTDAGTLAWTEAGDVASIAAAAIDRAAMLWTEGDDTASLAGVATDRASIAWTEQGDSAALTGAVANNTGPIAVTGALSWTEAGDTAALSVLTLDRAALAWAEQGDTWALAAYAAQPPVVTATVRFDPLPRNHGLKTVHFSN